MKQKFKTVVLSLFVALMGGLFFTSCNQDSLGLKTEASYLSADDYAAQLIESTVGIQQDLFTRNRQIFELPDRFSEELDRLAKVTTLKDLEDLINTTAFDFDLAKLHAKTQILEEVSEAISKNAFTEEDLSKEVSLQSQNQDWVPSHQLQLQLRGKMACLRAYDRSVSNILMGELTCIGATIAKTGGIASPACAVISVIQLIGANNTLSNCLAAAEK
jgi:hypothetical protein